jgi:uncharacterized NAD(P)/FAD-binding protein YdhS
MPPRKGSGPAERTIVIVGGGFCGALLASLLLRRPPPGSSRIVLVERAASVGRGAAYAAREFPYLLNVPAGRMSADLHDPEDFLRFVRERRPEATAEDFLPREWYGDYLQRRLSDAQGSAPARTHLEILHDTVTGVRRDADRWCVRFAAAREISADDVVLAVGNPPPAGLAATLPLLGHRAYVENPWTAPAELAGVRRVLLIGTGLTMVDLVIAASVGDRGPRVFHAISRHGLVPPRQTAFRADAFRGDGSTKLLDAVPSPRRMMRVLRQLAREAEYAGGDWREAMNFARRIAPQLWSRMGEADRRRFLRHARAYWDVHRHRLPAESLARIDDLRGIGRLRVNAGRLQETAPTGDAVRVSWRARGETRLRTLTVDRAVNCTGPDYDLARTRDVLLADLVQQGLVLVDPLGLGLRTTEDCALLDAAGRPQRGLYYVGPMLRADHWEATAAAELRDHVAQLATRLAGRQR